MSNYVYDLCTKNFGSAVYRGCCGYRKAVRFLIFAGGLRYLPYRTATFLNSGGNSATTILGDSGTSPDGLRFSSGIGVATRVAGLDWADISARAEVAPRPIGIVEKE